jgi:D-serine deaminase-like pyridoxal phosphate-dependent protein
LTIPSRDEKERAIRAAVGAVVSAADAIREAGIEVEIVSCGGTGSYEITSEIDGVTEIQAGGGCLMDRFYREMCGVHLANALYLVAAIGSRPTQSEAILDAGWKALPDKVMTPVCVDLPGAEVSQLYAEHMRLDLPSGSNPQIGDRLLFVPGYSDATTVLHNEFLGIRNGVVVEVIPLLARGALQ